MAGTIDGSSRVKIPGRPPTRTAQQSPTEAKAQVPRRARAKIAEHVETQKIRAAGLAGVEDSRSAGRTFKVRAAAAKSHGAAVELPPPRPPVTLLTAELQQGAESFVGNLDLIIDGLLLSNGGVAAAPPEYPPQVYRAALELLEALPLTTASAPLSATGTPLVPEGVEPTEAGRAILGQLFNLRDGTPEGRSVAQSLGVAADQVRPFANVNAESLLALFLILNIEDPNNAPETHNDLYEAASQLRQLAIDEAQAKAELALELRQELEDLAQEVQSIETITTVIAAVVAVALTVVVTVVTAGAATAPAIGSLAAGGSLLGGAGSAGSAAAAQVSAQLVAQTIQEAMASTVTKAITGAIMAAMQGALEVINAAQRAEVADAEADANEADNATDRARLRAERQQAMVEEEAAIVKLIMEAKNQTIDAVTQMLAAQLSTHQTVLAAGMVR